MEKPVKKGHLPVGVFKRLSNAFLALDITKDLWLFDIKKLKSSEERIYYRLRKGNYRAISYMEDDNFFVISIAKGEEVYKRWE